MKGKTAVLALILFAAPIRAAAPPAAPSDPEPARKGDRDRLQGKWVLVSMHVAGEEMDEDRVKKSGLVVKGGQWHPTLGGTALTPMTLKIDSSKSPKQLDLARERAKGRQMAWQGIYKIEGDTLTFCRSQGPGGGRPRAFEAGDGVVLAVYKRAGK